MEAPAPDAAEMPIEGTRQPAFDRGVGLRPMISVSGLVKKYGEQVAVAGIDLEIAEGEFFTLLGPSGCGKTTTLRCIAGLETPDAGEIRLGDETVARARFTVPTWRRNIGMVFQNYAVWPHMTVFDNVAFPLRVGSGKRPPESEIRAKVSRALETVGLEGLDKRMSTQLSGGQQQRLSLARAIVREPKVLLLDEPLSNLDSRLRQRMRVELALIQRQLGITTLFVTHDQIEALSMSDRVAVMRDGRIIQQAAPREIYHEPASPFVARFIGSTNLLEGRVAAFERDTRVMRVATSLGDVRVEDALDAPVGSLVDVAIRPEDVAVRGPNEEANDGHEPNVFEARVVIAQFIGGSVDALVEAHGTQIRLVVGSRTRWEEGDVVRFGLPATLCRILRREDHPPARVGG